jgi:hypothetical protein
MTLFHLKLDKSPYVVVLEHVMDGSNAVNMIVMIMQAIFVNGVISHHDLISKKYLFLVLMGLVCFRIITQVLLFSSSLNLFHSLFVLIAWCIGQI